jgi:hypothetical protein
VETFFTILSGGAGGAILTWLLRNWISERLKQSIRHEYAEKLEAHKAQLKVDIDIRIERIRHDYELSKLRTSLFFGHQRKAFAALLKAISNLQRKWADTGRDPDHGYICKPAPSPEYHQLKALYYENQLFLDDECMAALELLIQIVESSFSWIDGAGEEHH